MLCLILFVNIVFSYKYVYQSICSSVIKLTKVKKQVFLFWGKGYIENLLFEYFFSLDDFSITIIVTNLSIELIKKALDKSICF